jgi:hypothetical protein
MHNEGTHQKPLGTTTMTKYEDTKKDKLIRMAQRGGSDNERLMAIAALRKLGYTVNIKIKQEEKSVGETWQGYGVIARTRDYATAYVKGPDLAYFLSQIHDGQSVTYNQIKKTKTFSNHDFYVIISWLVANNLCTKHGARYRIPSKAAITNCWNKFVEGMKL